MERCFIRSDIQVCIQRRSFGSDNEQNCSVVLWHALAPDAVWVHLWDILLRCFHNFGVHFCSKILSVDNRLNTELGEVCQRPAPWLLVPQHYLSHSGLARLHHKGFLPASRMTHLSGHALRKARSPLLWNGCACMIIRYSAITSITYNK